MGSGCVPGGSFRGIGIQSFCGAALKDYFDVETVLEHVYQLFYVSQRG